MHLEPARPHRFLQVLLLRLRLRHLERLGEVAPQRDTDREARLERLRRKVERVRRVLVADRLRLLRREGEQVAAVACCQRRVQAREDRVVLELALRAVGGGVTPICWNSRSFSSCSPVSARSKATSACPRATCAWRTSISDARPTSYRACASLRNCSLRSSSLRATSALSRAWSTLKYCCVT